MTPEGRKLFIECEAWLRAGAPETVVAGRKIFGFDMARWVDPYTDCDAVCCVGGYIEQAAFGEVGSIKRLREYLDFSKDEYTAMFYPLKIPGVALNDYSEITPEMAADVIAAFLERGEITWPRKDSR